MHPRQTPEKFHVIFIIDRRNHLLNRQRKVTISAAKLHHKVNISSFKDVFPIHTCVLSDSRHEGIRNITQHKSPRLARSPVQESRQSEVLTPAITPWSLSLKFVFSCPAIYLLSFPVGIFSLAKVDAVDEEGSSQVLNFPSITTDSWQTTTKAICSRIMLRSNKFFRSYDMKESLIIPAGSEGNTVCLINSS